MGSKFCMNELCGSTTTSSEWRKGWGLKSGGFATLCYSCGSAYEKAAFCETFHLDESGWRECRMCRKPIHCGCIASKYLFEYMDLGGVGCFSCARPARHLGGQALRSIQIPNDDVPSGIIVMKNNSDTQPIRVENRMDQNIFDKGRLLQLGKSMEACEPIQLFQSQNDDKIKQEEPIIPAMEVSSCFPNLNQQSLRTSVLEKAENCIPKQAVKDSLNQPSLNFSLSTPVSTSSSVSPFPCGVGNVSPFQQAQKPHNILPKPPKAGSNLGFESKSGISTPTRVARPPAEGRGGRNHLLPRYWPRITDQELQKLSGDLKSTIVPLFEKVLSASDAGRIGRLVLPKACAEAYFPSINHSEGIPIRMQDIKGKEWTFQFRFWPNNNSRMYVLEGVTPCIQNMQLLAGDTVTFSRIDPEGKLVMGFRKATNNAETQVSQNSMPANIHTDAFWMVKHEKNGGRETDKSLQRNVLIPEKKKVQNIGCKNKRLLMHSEDAMELRMTWEEAQDLLRPPPTVNPTIVVIENHEFEEYDEPPVFGKRTIFTTLSSGEQEQWVQCDNCSKWRRLPVHILVPAKWTCSDNIWDSKRCSCAAPNEMNQKELDAFLRVSKVKFPTFSCSETKRRRIVESSNDGEPSGLDALASIAVLGESISELGEPSAEATTTKHPRHRPGCTCIVCIQPPSGKGKHEPACKCNVCLTVRRRFKTLMLRKKKKQSERELVLGLVQMNHSENEAYQNEDHMEDVGTSKARLDLNCHPNREDDMQPEAPLVTPSKGLLSRDAEESEGKDPDDGHVTLADTEAENKAAEG